MKDANRTVNRELEPIHDEPVEPRKETEPCEPNLASTGESKKWSSTWPGLESQKIGPPPVQHWRVKKVVPHLVGTGESKKWSPTWPTEIRART